MNTKTAVILGGGSSSRFYPFNTSNKALISIAGKTLFQRTIDALIGLGIKKIIVIDDSKGALRESLQSDSGIIFITQKESGGMGEALLLAGEHIQEDSFFVLSSYHFEIDLFAKDMQSALQSKADIVIVTKKDEDSSQFGAVTKENGRVTINEKSKKSSASRVVSMYLLNKAFLDALEKERKHQYSFEDAISSYNNGDIVLLESAIETISLKFPWDMLAVKDYILKSLKSFKGKNIEIASTAQINGNVHISDGVKIMEGVVIKGPAYIGEGAYIGNNAVLRNGVVVGKNAVIGSGMEVKNAIIMDFSKTHSGFIGDCIIGEYVKIAAGFITGNVRLDRGEISSIVKNEKINTHMKSFGCVIGNKTSFGIRVGTMPGVIIGEGVRVGPGTTVMENISDNVTYYTEFKKIIKK